MNRPPLKRRAIDVEAASRMSGRAFSAKRNDGMARSGTPVIIAADVRYRGTKRKYFTPTSNTNDDESAAWNGQVNNHSKYSKESENGITSRKQQFQAGYMLIHT